MSAAITGDLSPVPSHVPTGLVRDFDYIAGERILNDPFGTLDELLDGPSIVWSPRWGGHWIFTGMLVVREALQTPDLFSNNSSGIPQRPGGVFGPRPMIPVQIDPPDHAKYRRLLAPVFAPAAVEIMTTRVRDTCRELIEAVAPKGECDFLRDYAQPLPTRIFLHLMGLPEGRAELFRGWVHDLIYRSDDLEVRIKAGRAARAYLEQLVAERSANPGSDLISTMLTSTVDGRPVTVEEAYDTAVLMLVAGLDTVTAALGFSWQYLATHPDVRARLVADPSLIEGTVEELLRVHSFVNTPRRVTHDAIFHGVTLKEGDMVLLASALANRDPAVWPSPGEVAVSEKSRTHIAFGAGPHRCLGSHLARRELTLSMREWLKRIPDFEIPRDAAVTLHAGTNMGLNSLPLRWSLK